MTISHLKKQTGIKQSVCTPYQFHDQPWHAKLDPNSAIVSYLAHRCVRIGTSYFVFNPVLDVWLKQPDKAAAQAALLQHYVTGFPVPYMNHTLFITVETIKTFLFSQVVTLQATTYAPGMGHFVMFNDEPRLNVYKDLRRTGDTDDIVHAEEWLKIIRNSLCSEPDEIDLAAMLEEIGSDRPTKFRWVMHWLAARYQIPGFASGTNLWFLGKLGGVGKGTLVAVMRDVLGSAACGKVNQSDIVKGWTDSLFGKQLLEWDEFKEPSGWHAFNRLLKTFTGNDTIQTSARNIGGTINPAVGMHIFTTNEMNPVFVEQHDRRNTMIATTKDPKWASRCDKLFNPVTQEFTNPNLTSGFAALLNLIEIDMAFIRKPLETETRTDLRHMHSDTITQWIESGSLSALQPPGLAGEWSFNGWKDLYRVYREWSDAHTHVRAHDLSSFVKHMEEEELASTKVGKRTLAGGQRQSFRRVVINETKLQSLLGDDGDDSIAGNNVVQVKF